MIEINPSKLRHSRELLDVVSSLIYSRYTPVAENKDGLLKQEDYDSILKQAQLSSEESYLIRLYHDSVSNNISAEEKETFDNGNRKLQSAITIFLNKYYESLNLKNGAKERN